MTTSSATTNGTTFPQWFVAQYAPCDTAGRKSALRCAIACGYGSWVSPATAGTSQRLTAHQHSITLFGISICGTTTDVVADTWFAAASHLLAPAPDLATSPATLLQARRFALGEIIARVLANQVPA